MIALDEAKRLESVAAASPASSSSQAGALVAVEAEAERPSKRKAEALDICVHRREDGGWVISPMNDAVPLELQREPADRRQQSIIWRLDDDVFATAADQGGAVPLEKSSARSVSKRLKHAAAELAQLQTGTEALTVALRSFREEKAAFEEQKQEHEQQLEEQRAELDKREDALAGICTHIKTQEGNLSRDRAQFSADANEATEFLAAAMQTSLVCPNGEVAVPPEAFFAAAQGEFLRAAPQLNESHQTRMRILKAAPNMELTKAKKAFLANSESASSSEADLQRRIEAVVHAFLVADCMDVCSSPALHAMTLDSLAGMACTLAALANKAGRLPLAFAASCCAVWCAHYLAESSNAQWAEVSAPLFLKDLEAAEEVGVWDQAGLAQKGRLLVQHGERMQRVQRYWAEHGNHRRRFIRFFSSRRCSDPSVSDTIPGAAEADLRLLLLPASATPAELALQLERVKDLIDPHAVAARQQRKRQPPQSGLAREVT